MTRQTTAGLPLKPVAQIGPYRLGDTLGQGGMGIVYRAIHVDTGAEVAIKRVSALTGPHLASLRVEIRTLARMSHRGVVQILDEGLDEGVPWYAMELLSGQTLSAALDESWQRVPASEQATLSPMAAVWDSPVPAFAEPSRRLSVGDRLPDILRTLTQICEALAYVHEQGIVHRDLKPSNIFIRQRDGSPVLMDFGLVSRFRGTLSRENLENPGSGLGTISYMAPEQVRRDLVDARADLYSLGCILHEMLTGRPPFAGVNVADLREQQLSLAPSRPSALADGIPAELDQLVLALLAKRPQDRVGYADDVLDALESVSASLAGRPATARVRRSVRSYLYRPRLVGRSEELELLLDSVGRALATRTACFHYIGGESGSGKTTLANELARRCAVSGVRVLSGECLPLVGESMVMDPQEAPLHPLRPVLRAIADHCRAGGPMVARRVLDPWGPLLASHEPALLDLAGADGAGPPSLQGEATRDRLLGALTAVVLRFAREVPFLVLLDDLHWADELSLAFLRAAQNGPLAGAPVAVVGTYRSEEMSPSLAALIAEPAARQVQLRRLEVGAVKAMAADMLGMARPPEALTRFLMRVSEGNPFFVGEYLRAAASESLLVRRAGQWHLPAQSEVEESSAYEAMALPRSIQGLVSRRLAGLSAEAQSLVAKAAVLGREADAAVLRIMLGPAAGDLGRPLSELAARQVLDLVGPGRYRFVHDKIREAAFGALAAAERAATHLQAGQAIEAHSDHPDPFELAHHFRCGGRPDKAFHYARLAGQRARAAGAFRQARVHYGHALEIADAHGAVLAELGDAQELANLQSQLGEAMVVSGDYESGIETFRRACERLRVPLPPSGRLGWSMLGLRECVRLVLLRKLGLGTRLTAERRRVLGIAAEMTRWMSMAYLYLGRPLECMAGTMLGARLSEQAGLDGQRCINYAFLAGVCGVAGLRRLEARLIALSRESARRAVDILSPIWQATAEAVFIQYRDADWSALRAAAARAIAVAKAHNLVYDCQPIEFAVAMADLEQGQVAAAEALLRQIRERARALGHQAYENSSRGALLYCALHAGRFEEVLQAAGELTGAGSEKQAADLFLALAIQACASLRTGDQAGAARTAERALALLRKGAQLETRPLSVRGLFELTEVLLTLWRQAIADGRSTRALQKQAVGACRWLMRLGRRRAHVRPAALLQKARLQELRRQGARAVQSFQGVVVAARSLGLRPYEAFAQLDLARLPEVPLAERRAHAAQALALFEQMGYAWHRDRARALAQATSESES